MKRTAAAALPLCLAALPCLQAFLRVPAGAAEIGLTVTTPARAARRIADVPAAVSVLSPGTLRALPGAALDQKLDSAEPGLLSTRANGIYSFVSALTMRGLPGSEQGRTLIMLDGAPVNTGATGAVNWNRLGNEKIDRVEILKGPASALYGSNAAAGAINILTRPQDGYSASASYGTYRTFDLKAAAGVRKDGLALSVSGSALSSGGYISAPRADRDAYTVKKYVRERTAAFASSLETGGSGRLDLRYSHNDGLRGEGSRILAKDGVSRRYRTDHVRTSWRGDGAGLSWRALGYVQRENYARLNEYFRNGVYNRVDTNGFRDDLGAQGSVSMEAFYGVTSTFGFDYRYGSVDVADYRQLPADSRSYANDRGKMDILAPYLQAEKKLFSDRLRLLAGLRYDNAYFHDGHYSNTASGWTPANGPIDARRWESFSPRIAAGWEHGARLYQYVSYGRGFRSPALEDMCLSLLRGSGASARFTAGNPGLRPEKVDTIESGLRFSPFTGVFLDPNAYYTRGHGFIYEVNTNTTININGNRPVYRKENVSEVEIYGAELPVRITAGNTSLMGSYARSRSRILRFHENPALEGKKLTYAPRHVIALRLEHKAGFASFGAAWKRRSRQYTEDTNSASVAGYSVVSAYAAKTVSEVLAVGVHAENLFEKRHQQSASDLAPGRTFTVSLESRF